ncbi:hypothetical protein [Olleya sp. Bg11-27]|uniref:hypothetical protein n=1 Tax=Olleya sp. Bg11-27 TaxID=2058135 RepID=UPI0012FDC918|nr:hypothetical protein [Olleya sp. Bg11-27]
MKNLILFFSIVLTVSCKQATTNSRKLNQIDKTIDSDLKNKIDITPTKITKSIFNDYLKIDTSSDSILLFNQYFAKIEKNHNPIYITFRKCSSLSNKDVFNNNFNLVDSTDWYEEALLHKHFFYKKKNYIFILDTYNDGNLSKENRCPNKNKNDIIEKIRIFKYSEYQNWSKKTNRSTFSKKI